MNHFTDLHTIKISTPYVCIARSDCTHLFSSLTCDPNANNPQGFLSFLDSIVFMFIFKHRK
ncbi:hypothetical protein HanPSC8_Chr03g0121301 [Helianthus annuus]|nr:hypothetical protein HanPSC8_Chr03g0121301 [Helianthus annuus]